MHEGFCFDEDGWGVHLDERGMAKLYGVETEEYRRLSGAAESGLVVKDAMRSKRA